MRTGTLWFNPPNNAVTSSHPDLTAANDNNVLAGTDQVQPRKQSVQVGPESK